ncbi:hypothetical protein LTR70_010116 [Exophiala xenobiotica]|uniref:BTB domain-containing protein n=1 Tax=Lithohypha guttulata TaxID=1690604 RepID=A0ABR0JV13_9EURO|nr:hypothetical protein LTR24_010065 [Lithohypha guttulata]KAK5309634.1 hypothetical protein LTR70_010116 [Exophiala xenobiotica]
MDSLLRSLHWLQTSHAYSDLKLLCQDEVFQVHKAVICSRSQYFATSCKWGKEGKLKEEIELKDDDSKLIGLMVDYLYQLEYDDLLPSRGAVPMSPSIEEPLIEPEPPVAQKIHSDEDVSYQISDQVLVDEPAPESDLVGVPEAVLLDADGWSFGASKKSKKDKKKRKKGFETSPEGSWQRPGYGKTGPDKYGIDDLKDLARTKFEQAVADDWDSQAFAHAAELAFNTTPGSDRGLRAAVIKTINDHRELIDYEEIRALLDSGNGIAWALVKVLLGNHERKGL